MKFLSRFAVGDYVWSDHSPSYYDLTQYKGSRCEGIEIAERFANGEFIIGVSLVKSRVESIHLSTEVDKKGKVKYNVCYSLADFGTSSRGESETYGRGVWATEEEAIYGANKAYLKRLMNLIKHYQNTLLKKDEHKPSYLQETQTKLEKLQVLKLSVESHLLVKPKVKKIKTVRLESKYDLGQEFWTTESSDHVYPSTVRNFTDFRSISCLDVIDERYDEETISQIIKTLSEKPKKFNITGIRNYTNNGDFLYAHSYQQYGSDYFEHLISPTKEKAEEFFNHRVFVNRKPVLKSELIQRTLDALQKLSNGDISTKDKRKIEGQIKKLTDMMKA